MPEFNDKFNDNGFFAEPTEIIRGLFQTPKGDWWLYAIMAYTIPPRVKTGTTKDGWTARIVGWVDGTLAEGFQHQGFPGIQWERPATKEEIIAWSTQMAKAALLASQE